MRVIELQAGAQPVLYTPARLVTVKLFCALTGRTDKAVRRKIEDGRWIQGREYHRDPDGGVNIDMHRVEQWVTGTA